MARCSAIISCCDLPMGISGESSKESSLLHSYNVSYKLKVSSYSGWTIVCAVEIYAAPRSCISLSFPRVVPLKLAPGIRSLSSKNTPCHIFDAVDQCQVRPVGCTCRHVLG